MKPQGILMLMMAKERQTALCKEAEACRLDETLLMNQPIWLRIGQRLRHWWPRRTQPKSSTNVVLER